MARDLNNMCVLMEETTSAAVEELSHKTLYDLWLISDEVTELFLTINHSILAAVVATVAIVTNVINIVIFSKQGFSDSINVSCFALAVSDLCSVLTLQWINLLRNPLFVKSVDSIIPSEVFHLSAGWPHGFFTRLTGGITAYITFERCLCVLVPLKIKTIVTPKLAVTVIVSIFVILFLALLPDYATAYIGWKFDPAHNKTMLGLLFTAGRAEMAVLSFTLAAYLQIIFFVAVVVFTLTLVIKIRQISKWRASTSSVGKGTGKEIHSRDNKLVKMVLLIAIIYCVCFVPFIVNFLATTIAPEFSVPGRYENIFFVSWSFAFLVDSINAAVNLFVYYRMSTKYRQTFDSLFCRGQNNALGLK